MKQINNAQSNYSSPRDPIRLLVLQRILPPYRLPFFQALARSSKLSLTLAYGLPSQESALESIVDPPDIQTQTLKNNYYGKSETVILQQHSLPYLLRTLPDAVIAEFNPRIFTNVFACLLARRKGLKFIWWGHGFRPKSGALDKHICLWLASMADALIFYTAEGAEGFIRRGVPKEKTFVAWNSIDMEEIERLSQPVSITERKRILCIGRLIPQKKVDLLIRGFAQAAPHLDPHICLTIIGEGPERAALEQLALQLNLQQRIEFVGSLYDQSLLAPYFNDSLVSVSSGYIGLSAVHSLAYGVPMIVADKEPHSPEIVAIEEGVNSLYFRADDENDLAEKLVAVLQDQKRLERMSVDAKVGVRRRFSLSAMVAAFEEALQFAFSLPQGAQRPLKIGSVDEA